MTKPLFCFGHLFRLASQLLAFEVVVARTGAMTVSETKQPTDSSKVLRRLRKTREWRSVATDQASVTKRLPRRQRARGGRI